MQAPRAGRARGQSCCRGLMLWGRERGEDRRCVVQSQPYQPSCLPKTAHGLGALVLPFVTLVDGWPLEATCPLLCATWRNLSEKGWMDTYSDLAWLFYYPQQTEFREEQQKIASRPEKLIYKERLGAKFV